MANVFRSRLRSRLETRARSVEQARALLPLARVLRLGEIAGGPLLLAAMIALVWANLPGDTYSMIWDRELTLAFGGVARTEPLERWVTDALLPVFFLVAGLEIKRSLVHGELGSWRRAALPVSVAIGGMLGPAGCYLAMTWGREGTQGWAIPVATDIAFALAVLAVLGDRVPRAVKILTLAFAALDDIGGTLIIAVVYTRHLNPTSLGFAAGFLLLIVACRSVSVRGELIYWVLGAGFVASVLQGGVHSTVAGFALGILAPSRPLFSRADLVTHLDEVSAHISELDERLTELENDGEGAKLSSEHEELLERQEALLGELEELTVGYESPVDRELRRVLPWVSYMILPLFALANAGVRISVDTLASVFTLGPGLAVVVALLLGKPAGFLLAASLVLATGVAERPPSVGWLHLTIAGMVAGIGFTVSLFVAQLAFSDGALLDQVKLAVLLASATSAALAAGTGYLLLPAQED